VLLPPPMSVRSFISPAGRARRIVGITSAGSKMETGTMIWGRPENVSQPMKVNVSETTYLQVKGAFHFVRRPTREIKDKGVMQMYFVEG
jgi:hypothetical protein